MTSLESRKRFVERERSEAVALVCQISGKPESEVARIVAQLLRLKPSELKEAVLRYFPPAPPKRFSEADFRKSVLGHDGDGPFILSWPQAKSSEPEKPSYAIEPVVGF